MGKVTTSPNTPLRLDGSDALRQLRALLHSLKPGETMRVDRQAFIQIGPSLLDLQPPEYNYTTWVDDVSDHWVIRRDQ